MTTKSTRTTKTEPDEQDQAPEQDQAATDDPNGTPDGYERGQAAVGPAGTLIAFGADVRTVMREAAAAGHDRPMIVPAMRPKPDGE
jgi:hypothetical protein